MHYYILDPGNISQEKYERYQIELQGLLNEFNVSGETARVTPLRSISELVNTASNRGAKTIVACGSDDTFNLMLANLSGRDFVLGFIPFTDDSYLAHILGTGNLANAVKVIAGRRIEKIDLANVGNNYFISYLELGSSLNSLKSSGFFSKFKFINTDLTQLTLRIDNTYTLTTPALSALIINTRPSTAKDASLANPTDGYLDILILEKLSTRHLLKYSQVIREGLYEYMPHSSVIRCKQVECLAPNGCPIRLAGKIITKAPAIIQISPERQRVIVGKNRTF